MSIDEVRFDLFDLTRQELDDLLFAIAVQRDRLRMAIPIGEYLADIQSSRVQQFHSLGRVAEKIKAAAAPPFASRRADLCA